MESDSFALRTALFIVAAGALLVFSVVLFTRAKLETVPYMIRTTESVAGLQVESRIYYKGVEVGTERDIGFEPGDYNAVRIIIDVDQRIPLGTNTFARLSLRGITGEYDLTLDNEGGLGDTLVTSELEPAELPMRSELVASLGNTMEDLLDEVRQLSRNLTQLTDQDNRDNIARLLEASATTAEQLAALTERIGEDTRGLPEALENFSGAMAEVQNAARSLNERTGNLDGLIASVDQTLNSANALVVSLQTDTLGNVDDTLISLRIALNELSGLARQLQDDPQSLLFGPPPIEPGPGEQPQSER